MRKMVRIAFASEVICALALLTLCQTSPAVRLANNPNSKAGGGLVYNKAGDVLFIFRNGKWDLPKGGIEKGEEIEDTAIREVEEETGVTNLKITHKLQKTYHVFKRGGKYKLKVTHWYEMRTDFNGTPKPQANEGIEKVAWLGPAEIKEALKNSYENIKLLFQEEELLR